MELKDVGLRVASVRINANMSAYELSLKIGKMQAISINLKTEKPMQP